MWTPSRIIETLPKTDAREKEILGARKGSIKEGIVRGGMLDKIRAVLEEEAVIDSSPRLVATPLPIAVSLEQAAALLAVAPSTL